MLDIRFIGSTCGGPAAFMRASDGLLLRNDRTAPRPQRELAARGDDPSHSLADAAATGPRAVAARSRITPFILAFLTVLLFVCVAVRLMNYELRRDEQLYVPPAKLLDDLSLYSDFFYNHPPGSAWLFHAIRQLTGSDHLLLDGRIGVLGAWILLAAAVGLVSLAITRSSPASWCITALFLANELFLTQPGMTATNNFLPLPLSFLGLGLFILGVRDGIARTAHIALAGLCLSLAVVVKLSAIAFIPPIAVAALLLPKGYSVPARLKRVVAPLALGGVIGGLPILAYLMSAPRLFLAHVVGYHLGPHLEHARRTVAAGEEAVTSLSGKVQLALDLWFASTVAIGLVALFGLILMARPRADEPRSSLPVAPLVLVGGAAAAAVALSLLPTPSFPQYYAPPLLCLPLGLALVFGGLQPRAKSYAMSLLAAAACIALLAATPRLVQFAGTIMKPSQWTVMRVHAAGVAIARKLDEAGTRGKLATLAPLYALEGGLEVYPELATGIFAYRTGDFVAPDLARFYRMTSPARVSDLLESEPPAALLLGFEPELEAPMLDYALRHGYAPVPDFKISDRYGTAQLYLRPGP